MTESVVVSIIVLLFITALFLVEIIGDKNENIHNSKK